MLYYYLLFKLFIDDKAFKTSNSSFNFLICFFLFPFELFPFKLFLFLS